jgi:hypothetical protein
VKLSTILIIGAIAAILVSAAQASHFGGGNARRALMIRSEALNRQYHLGTYSPSAFANAQNRAIRLRSIALNRQYHLGAFAK